MDAATQRRRVVIIGGGFGGLACARGLAGADVEVTLVDRRNHHLFQPLLYQVSTAALSPADIAIPIRRVVAKARNIRVLLAEVRAIDSRERRVDLTGGDSLLYDQLVVATGAAYNYFAHPEWAAHAPAPKTIRDARAIRARLLEAFELAERTDDPERRRALLTFVIVGGGPTGVEMAGTTAELAHHTLKGNFRRIDPASACVILAEAGPRLLAAFPEELGRYAAEALGEARRGGAPRLRGARDRCGRGRTRRGTAGRRDRHLGCRHPRGRWRGLARRHDRSERAHRGRRQSFGARP
jgi:NADH dehydrogenase